MPASWRERRERFQQRHGGDEPSDAGGHPRKQHAAGARDSPAGVFGETIEQPVDRLSRWRAVLNLPGLRSYRKKEILRSTADGVNVTATSASRIIRVDCDSSNPKVAADYANALAEEFINERLESHCRRHRRPAIPDEAARGIKGAAGSVGRRLAALREGDQPAVTSDQGTQSVSEQKLGQLQANYRRRRKTASPSSRGMNWRRKRPSIRCRKCWTIRR